MSRRASTEPHPEHEAVTDDEEDDAGLIKLEEVVAYECYRDEAAASSRYIHELLQYQVQQRCTYTLRIGKRWSSSWKALRVNIFSFFKEKNTIFFVQSN